MSKTTLGPLAASIQGMARGIAWLAVITLLSACAVPGQAPAPLLYDFGPVMAVTDPAGSQARPLLAVRVQASTALDSTAMLYRLAYDDARQLRAYSQARWAMAPAEMVQQRLRDGLGRQFALLQPGDSAPRVLLVELEEFSHLFESPQRSSGLLRVHASLLQRSPTGMRVLAQRDLLLQQAATSADAAGGVRALTAATDAAVQELLQWLQTLP